MRKRSWIIITGAGRGFEDQSWKRQRRGRRGHLSEKDRGRGRQRLEGCGPKPGRPEPLEAGRGAEQIDSPLEPQWWWGRAPEWWGGPSWHFDFRLPPPRTVRKEGKEACVLSSKVSATGNEYRKPTRVGSLAICTVFWVKTSEVSASPITSRMTSRLWAVLQRDGAWGGSLTCLHPPLPSELGRVPLSLFGPLRPIETLASLRAQLWRCGSHSVSTQHGGGVQGGPGLTISVRDCFVWVGQPALGLWCGYI